MNNGLLAEPINSAKRFNRIWEGISGSAKEVAKLREEIDRMNLRNGSFIFIWQCLIIRLLNEEVDKETRNELFNLGERLSRIEHPDREMYQDLFSLSAFPKSVPPSEAIKVGAHAAKMIRDASEGECPSETLIYMELAKKSLLNALNKGEEETRGFAAIVLRNYHSDAQVKDALMHIVENGASRDLKKNSENSLRYIRMQQEKIMALFDMAALMMRYPAKTIQEEFLRHVYSAVEKVFKHTDDPKKAGDVSIAITQLSKFNVESGAVRNLFDSDSLMIIERSVENALLHSLTTGSKKMRAQASAALKERGSERLCDILAKISDRDSEDAAVREEAVSALDAIQDKRWNYDPPIPLITRRPKIEPKALSDGDMDLPTAHIIKQETLKKRASFLERVRRAFPLAQRKGNRSALAYRC